MKNTPKTIAAAALLFLGTTGIAFADDISLSNPLSCDDLTCVAGKIVSFLYTIAIPITVIMVLVGAFQMMTSGGDPQKFSDGRKTITYAAIGFAVILIAGSLVTLIKNILGAS